LGPSLSPLKTALCEAIFGFDSGITIFYALDFVLIFEMIKRDNAASKTRRSG
jgi:hypothetical protein